MIPLLTLERLVKSCSEMEVRGLVGMVLEPLYKMPGSVVVAVWEGKGGGLPEVLNGVTEDWVGKFWGLRWDLSW